ncbi:MAG: hypothetical protein AB7I59_05690 [Geminicoccaceae bacterium]
MSRTTLTMIAALMAAHAGAVHAGQVEKLPPSGKAKFQVSYLQWDGNDVDMSGRAGFGNMEFGGITRNLDGKSWFDRMTEYCTGQYYWGVNDQPGNGSCLYVDADGDQVMVNWSSSGDYDGTKQIVGGTGKYMGITGKGTFDGTQLKAAATGMDFFLTDVELDFQLKPPTQ